MRAGWTYMKHPQSGGVAEVTEEAFDGVWSNKGWVETSEDEYAAYTAESEEIAGSEFDVASAKKPDLIRRATVLGVDPTGTVEELRERLSAADGSA